MFLKQPRSSRQLVATQQTNQQQSGYMQVIQVFGRPASQAFYSVAGRLLFIESFNLQLRNSIELLFSGWQLTPVSSPDRSPDIRITFFCGDKPPDIPDSLNRFEIAKGGQCYTSDGE